MSVGTQNFRTELSFCSSHTGSQSPTGRPSAADRRYERRVERTMLAKVRTVGQLMVLIQSWECKVNELGEEL